MNITPPRIPTDLKEVSSFAEYARDFLPDDLTIEAIQCDREQAEGADFYKADVRTSMFANCTFHGCDFEKAGFIDVVFQSCDFSNSKFHEAYFERCRFISCKCIGIDMVGVMMKQTVFQDTNLHYANFNTVKMNGVAFDRVDFTEASLAEAKLKFFTAAGSKFIRNDFNKTLLNGIDFSENELIAPIVSNPPIERKGIIVDMFQAADLIGIWGVKVKWPLAEDGRSQ